MTTNWDEAEHPRDKEGKFTYKNEQTQYNNSEDKVQNRANLLYPTMNIENTNITDREKETTTNQNTNNLQQTKETAITSKAPLLIGSISYDNIKPSDKNFLDAMHIIFKHEGGYSNDPNDFGGVTNMGITQTTYNSYCKRHNLQTKDVKYLTQKEAMQIYYNDYWKASGADKITHPIGALIVFDTAILHGVQKAKQYHNLSNDDYAQIVNLRKMHYLNQVEKYPSQKRFLKGWNNRANNLINILNEYSQNNT